MRVYLLCYGRPSSQKRSALRLRQPRLCTEPPSPSEGIQSVSHVPTDTPLGAALPQAEVGDDVLGDDPTVRALEAAAAATVGKSAALLVPSGTMGNLIAVLAHCHERGAEVIVGDESHVYVYEAGGMSARPWLPAGSASFAAWLLARLCGHCHGLGLSARVKRTSLILMTPWSAKLRSTGCTHLALQCCCKCYSLTDHALACPTCNLAARRSWAASPSTWCPRCRPASCRWRA